MVPSFLPRLVNGPFDDPVLPLVLAGEDLDHAIDLVPGVLVQQVVPGIAAAVVLGASSGGIIAVAYTDLAQLGLMLLGMLVLLQAVLGFDNLPIREEN